MFDVVKRWVSRQCEKRKADGQMGKARKNHGLMN